MLRYLIPKISCQATRNIYDSTYPANNPSEDRIMYICDVMHQNRKIDIVGIFDGHGGWQVSNFVSQNIGNSMIERMITFDHSNEVSTMNLLKDAFNRVERQYMEDVKSSFNHGFGEVAKVGCCATLAVRFGDYLTIANTGDCRAVLGTSTNDDDNDNILGIRLTSDHNAREALEDYRLRMEHPNENNIIVCKSSTACYVKGRLQLTRALGDAYLKMSSFNAPSGKHRSWGRHIAQPYTPPYVDSRPQLHRVTLNSKDKFLILATDGVWDFLSDQEATDVVKIAIQNDEDPALALREKALLVAALESGMSIEELRTLPPGRARRSRHDDTTALVLIL